MTNTFIDSSIPLLSNRTNPARDALATQLFKIIMRSGDPDEFKKVLDAGGHGELARINSNGDTLLHCAVQEGCLAIIAVIMGSQPGLGKGIIDYQNADGSTALHIATQKGDEDMIRILVTNGAYFNIHDKKGNTPLHNAISGHFYKILEYYLSHCEGVWTWYKNRNALLKCGVICDDQIVIDQLLLYGQNNEVGDNKNKSRIHDCDTALFYAIVEKKYDMVRFLVDKKKADVNYHNRDRQGTLLYYATRENDVTLMDMLVNAGATVDAGDMTPLYAAVEQNNIETVRYLIKKGANA